jgi:glycerophosphoryl diester phosphodiesterase
VPPRPEIIAHRGASAERPENTVAAFVRAAELGADAVELDVHLTADGQLAVHHDADVGPPGQRRALRSLTLADVAALRVAGEPVPTLDAVVSAVGARVRIYCELKGIDTAAPACRLLRPLGDGAAVHSFDHRLVAAARAADGAVPRGVLEVSYHVDPAFPLRSVDARDLWQDARAIDADLIREIHAAGGRVVAWTVNDPGRAVALAELGCDGICTDDVARIRNALGIV